MAQFDNWPPLQDFTFQKFNFHSHKYEMWEAGRMIRSGEVHCNITYAMVAYTIVPVLM